MVCLNSGKNGKPQIPDLFLFIVDRSGVQQPSGHCEPPGPDIADVKSQGTAAWTNGEKTYLLVGLGNADFLKQYY